MDRWATGFVAAVVEAWHELRIHKLRVLLSLVGVMIAVASLTSALAAAGIAKQAGFSQAQIDATEAINLFFWRPNGWGGIPEITGGNGGQLNVNEFDMARVSASLRGTLEGGWVDGIGWEDYGADMREGQAGMNRPAFTHQLGKEWLPGIPELHARLQADPPARILDVGPGSGINLPVLGARGAGGAGR